MKYRPVSSLFAASTSPADISFLMSEEDTFVPPVVTTKGTVSTFAFPKTSASSAVSPFPPAPKV